MTTFKQQTKVSELRTVQMISKMFGLPPLAKTWEELAGTLDTNDVTCYPGLLEEFMFVRESMAVMSQIRKQNKTHQLPRILEEFERVVVVDAVLQGREAVWLCAALGKDTWGDTVKLWTDAAFKEGKGERAIVILGQRKDTILAAVNLSAFIK